MGILYDAVGGKADQLPKTGAVAGYDDGAQSAWTAAEWAAVAGRPQLHITVLANPASDTFDLEQGNAPADRIAAAISSRYQARRWSVLYCTAGVLMAQGQPALATRGLTIADPARWPAPGVYWWAADWTGTAHLRAGSIATQWTDGLAYDTSSTLGAFPALPGPAPQPPHPPPLEEETEMLMIRQTGGSVALTDGTYKVHVTSPADQAAFASAGIRLVDVTDAQYNAIPDAETTAPPA